MSGGETLICADCGVEFLRPHKYGMPPKRCAACKQEAAARSKKAFRERNPDYHRQWRERNADKVRAYQRTSYKKHRRERLAARKKWAANNPEKMRWYSRRWRTRNRRAINMRKRQRTRLARLGEEMVQAKALRRAGDPLGEALTLIYKMEPLLSGHALNACYQLKDEILAELAER